MRYVLENIEAAMLTREIQRRGIADRQRLRVIVETLDDDLPLAKFAEEGGSFAFLADEPDLYSLVPSAETIDAMKAARKCDVKTVGDLDDLMSDLHADD